jgi:hypothetical protein
MDFWKEVAVVSKSRNAWLGTRTPKQRAFMTGATMT